MSSDDNVLFGKIAMELGLLTKEQIDTAISLQEMENRQRPLGDILLEKRYLTQAELQKILGQQRANLSKVDSVTQQKKEDSLFGKVAIREGLATADEVNDCLRAQAKAESAGTFPRLGEMMVEKGILTTAQVQRILERQKRRIMVCKGCKARYNVPAVDEGKPVRCPRCGGEVVLPTEIGSIQVDGSFDGSATQVLPIVPQPQQAAGAPRPAQAGAPQSRTTPPAPVPAAPRPAQPTAIAGTSPAQTALPGVRPQVAQSRRATVVMKSPFAVGGAGGEAPGAATAPPRPAAPAAPAQPQGAPPSAGAPAKTPAGGVPAVRIDAQARPATPPPPKPQAATRTPTAVQRIMPAPGGAGTSGIMRAVPAGGPKKVDAICPICDHTFNSEVDGSTGRVKCPQCKTSFSPH